MGKHPIHLTLYREFNYGGRSLKFCLLPEERADVAREQGILYVGLDNLTSIHREQTPGGIADEVSSIKWKLSPEIYITLFEHWHGDVKKNVHTHGVDWLRQRDVLCRMGNRLTLTGEGTISCLHGDPWHFNEQASSWIAYTGDKIKTHIVPRHRFPLRPAGRGGPVIDIPGIVKDMPWPW